MRKICKWTSPAEVGHNNNKPKQWINWMGIKSVKSHSNDSLHYSRNGWGGKQNGSGQTQRTVHPARKSSGSKTQTGLDDIVLGCQSIHTTIIQFPESQIRRDSIPQFRFRCYYPALGRGMVVGVAGLWNIRMFPVWRLRNTLVELNDSTLDLRTRWVTTAFYKATSPEKGRKDYMDAVFGRVSY